MERLTQTRFFELVTSPKDDANFSNELESAYHELSPRICQTTFAEEDFTARYNALSEASIHLHALQGRISLLGSKKKRGDRFFLH